MGLSAQALRRPLSLLFVVLALSGCAIGNLKTNLGKAIVDNDNLELVGKGLPTYLLMMDAMVRTWPEDADTLTTAAKLYGAYAGIYVTDEAAAAKMTEQALDYALRAACASNDDFCHADTMPFDHFKQQLNEMDADDLPMLFTLGSSWAGWIQGNTSDWNAIAQLARVRLIMQRIIAIDSAWNFGQAHMYMGVLHSLLPKALGGHPKKAKQQFELAIELSGGDNLMAKVLYAKRYARMAGDQALFQTLLDEVLAADPHREGLTLQNVYAQKQAAELLAEKSTN